MKAVVIAGGRGTRLRPLTLSVTKPLIEFCNKPILEYQIRAAIEGGVNHVILATCNISNDIKQIIENLQRKYKIKIECSIENVPLGTAGPIKLAEQIIMDPDDPSENILVFNGDIICNYPITELISAHICKDADVTILATKVENPSSFGVILHNDDMRVDKFVEKPSEFIGNLISAGMYVMNKRVIADIPLKNTSIERFLFPKIAERHRLYCYPFEGLWSDVGTPKDYLKAQELYIKLLSQTFEHENQLLHSTSFGNLFSTSDEPRLSDTDPGATLVEDLSEIKFNVIPPILIHPDAVIGKGCKIGPNVCISSNVTIGEGCRIRNSSIMSDVNIGNYCFIDGAILGWSCKLNNWTHIEGLSVFGEEVEINESLVVCGSYILPHKIISESIYQSGTIIM
ncbi:mannose-1-phosphate guanylyltransferase [Babesia microti strain RI]|uniref:mannose-1-phosphate guanylyltransferase n=1 Tax=Babesia microti (strain RI) TaxID=1133968 RepID=A0A1N6LYE8_BABMR|nr:mannose-1-phosphate guanylyltransferase [Babesia microti strain RI]SIO73874.1 mannose-1-phosphate guanylyltransferase [Babesia microti strain RI]|eukprot:XP_021337926.1 mannose-1-phosphate guanylyltransferase [Babesia microti strain RI]